jgi:putative transposase
MTAPLPLNMLIAWSPPEGPSAEIRVDRILWCDPAQIHLVTIDVFAKDALPLLRPYDEVARGIERGDLRVPETDPFAALRRAEADIAEKHRQRRDVAWELIGEMVESGDVDFLINPTVRGRRIAVVMAATRRTKRTIYKYLRRFWQGGQIKNALLPGFEKCGGRGKRRMVEAGREHDASKLGRRSALAKVSTSRIGVRLSADIERKFERGIRKFYENTSKRSLIKAFKKTLGAFFYVDVQLKDGVPGPILPPAEQLPTFEQFRHWYETVFRDVKREHEKRHGRLGHALTGRELTGDSTRLASGPGSVFQIDATLADVYLVSSLDRTRIVGRPVIYVCIDVYSRMITGIAVLLEGPSWVGAMLALDNVVADKVEYCAKYGIKITEDQWPSRHLPDALTADRGEFEGYDATNLANSFGIRVENTAAYRGDWKGIVERRHGRANERIIHFLPGAVHKRRQRGEPDPRLDAMLTLDEFHRVIIFDVLAYNQHHYMESYKKDGFQIADHVEPYPLEIWQWGIARRSGKPPEWTRDIVRLNVLPQKTVSVTPHGIQFERDIYYTCDTAVREGWFDRARIRGNWKVKVSYDPRTLDNIYLRTDGGRGLEQCRLTPASKTFKNSDLYTALDYFELERQAAEASRSRTFQADVDLDAQCDHVVAEAREKTLAAQRKAGAQSKRSRIGQIRENRAAERQYERDRTAWQPGEDYTSQGPADVIPIRRDDAYVPPARKADLIRSRRDKMWEDGDE